MFNSLYGTLTEKLARQPSGGAVFIETGGVEWEILVPATALGALPDAGQKARVYTWLYHREDQMSLFGFASSEDRLLFLDLLKVDGVGAKAAIKIMSSIDGGQLRRAIENEELERLEAVSGIGKKTAQKMMLALKGRLTFPSEKQTGGVKPWQDIISALTDMGYDRREAEAAIAKITAEIAEGKSDKPTKKEFETLSREAKEELLFRRAITELSR
jgi:Holliday junction DNA helicase RuvA